MTIWITSAWSTSDDRILLMAAPDMTPSPSQLSALLKGLSVLEAVMSNDRLSDLSRATGLSYSTVHRILADLAEGGWVYQDEDRHYHPGRKMHAIAGLLRDDAEIVRQARPHMERLRQRTGMTVHLGVVHADEVVYAAKLDGHGSYRMLSRVGGSVPLYSTSIGKAVLAQFSDEEVQQILQRTGMRQITPGTHRTLGSLLADLDATRKRGWAIDEGENEVGLRCVGASIVDAGGRAFGGVSVSALEFEMPNSRLAPVAADVTEAAREISASLSAA